MGTLHNDVTQSQNKAIWAHLSKGNKITQDEAKSLFRCARLASRINNLKNKYDMPDTPAIESKLISVLNGDGKAVRIAQYSINPAYVARLAQAVQV